MNKFWKVLLWALFWYYLAPYYLLRKYVFHGKHQVLWSSLVAIVLVLLCFGKWADSISDDTTEHNSEPKTHVVVKKVGSKELAKSKAKQAVLIAEEKKKQKEYDKLSEELAAAKKEEKEKEQQAKKQAAQAEKEREKQAKEAQAASESSRHRSTSSHHTASENKGDMNTADPGKIVGNVNSKIYHVPGQAGYRMNSANAVYFNSEQDAINAGYRKAKR